MKKVFVITVVLLLVISGIVIGKDKGSKSGTEKVQTIRGEVIDVSCYIAEGARGEAHKDCAISCIKAGQPAGILEDKSGKVYIAAKAEDHLKNPGTELLPYVAKMVEVKGVVFERGGAVMIDIREIKEIGNTKSKIEKKGSGMEEEKKGSGY